MRIIAVLLVVQLMVFDYLSLYNQSCFILSLKFTCISSVTFQLLIGCIIRTFRRTRGMVVGGTTDSFLWECIKQSLCVIGLDKNRQTRKKETMH